MDLQPLHQALDHLEQAVAGVAEKISTAVTDQVDHVSQTDVDTLVQRAEGLAERLTGLQAPATTTAASPATVEAPAADAAAPAWTPEHPTS